MLSKWLETLYEADPPAQRRARLIRLAGLAGILANGAFAALKLAVGFAANSIAIVSDAVNNLTDALSSVITLIGLKLAERPPDRKHPLGYGRIEYISGMVIAAIVLVTGIEFLQSSVNRILNPRATSYAAAQFVILAVTIVGKMVLARLNIVVGKKTDSDSLVASGTDAKMDVLASTLTLAAAVVSMLTGWHIDGYMGVALSLFILYTAIGLIRDTVGSIIGTRPDKELADKIRTEVVRFSPIQGAYDLIIHNYGPSTKLGSLNLEIPDTATIEKTYAAMTAAQQCVYVSYGIYFTFGLYSVNTYDKEIISLRENVRASMAAIPGMVSLHAFNYDKAHKVIRFDVVVDFSVRDFSAFRRQATDALREQYPDKTVLMNIDLDYA